MDDPNTKICVVDALPQASVGGRLKSMFLDGMPNSALELGGMQFMFRHQMVHSLVQDLKLRYIARQFPSSNWNFIRNTRLYAGDWSGNEGRLPYFFSPAERQFLKSFGEHANAGTFLYKIFSEAHVPASVVNGSSRWSFCDWSSWKRTSTFGNMKRLNANLGWYGMVVLVCTLTQTYRLLLSRTGCGRFRQY